MIREVQDRSSGGNLQKPILRSKGYPQTQIRILISVHHNHSQEELILVVFIHFVSMIIIQYNRDEQCILLSSSMDCGASHLTVIDLAHFSYAFRLNC